MRRAQTFPVLARKVAKKKVKIREKKRERRGKAPDSKQGKRSTTTTAEPIYEAMVNAIAPVPSVPAAYA